MLVVLQQQQLLENAVQVDLEFLVLLVDFGLDLPPDLLRCVEVSRADQRSVLVLCRSLRIVFDSLLSRTHVRLSVLDVRPHEDTVGVAVYHGVAHLFFDEGDGFLQRLTPASGNKGGESARVEA